MFFNLSAKNNGGDNEPLTGPSRSAQWVEFFSLVKSLAIFFGIAFMLRASVVEAFKIPSSSMEPTLQIGDHILVNKLSYGLRLPFKNETALDFRTPKRGDVVVFTLPDDPKTPEIDEAETNIIKRVIGLPGDRIEVRGTELYINGNAYVEDEEYAIWVHGGRKDFGPVEIPEGRVLLLGDNRDQSKDSRYWNDPFLDISRIKGRAFIIYWNWPSPLKRIFHIIN
ncbi:MAG: signal peptidase I [Bdellovibrionales bacterium]|nr:signal peptidase I [Bdellovibrionales bacterium]